MPGTHAHDPHRLVAGAAACEAVVAVRFPDEAIRRRVQVELTVIHPIPPTGAARRLLNASPNGLSCLPERLNHFGDRLVGHRDPTCTHAVGPLSPPEPAEPLVRLCDGSVASSWLLRARRRGELRASIAVSAIRQRAANVARSVLGAAVPAGATGPNAPVTGRTARDDGPPDREEARMAAQSAPGGRARRPAGFTVWLTGLPSAGKSGVARELATLLRAEGHRVEVLDGHESRSGLPPGPGPCQEACDSRVRRVGMVAEVLARNGVIVLVPVIAPRRADREGVRLRHDLARLPYLEIHAAAPLEVCDTWDAKGLSTEQTAGETTGPTGVDDPYEAPQRPDLRLDTHHESVAESANAIHAMLCERGLI